MKGLKSNGRWLGAVTAEIRAASGVTSSRWVSYLRAFILHLPPMSLVVLQLTPRVRTRFRRGVRARIHLTPLDFRHYIVVRIDELPFCTSATFYELFSPYCCFMLFQLIVQLFLVSFYLFQDNNV